MIVRADFGPMPVTCSIMRRKKIPLRHRRETIKCLGILAVDDEGVKLHGRAGRRQLFGGRHRHVHLVAKAIRSPRSRAAA